MEKGTEDTSKLVQIEEVKCAIEKLPFVTVFKLPMTKSMTAGPLKRLLLAGSSFMIFSTRMVLTRLSSLLRMMKLKQRDRKPH